MYLKTAVMKQVKIYALSSSEKPDNIRYIGKTVGELKDRLYRFKLN